MGGTHSSNPEPSSRSRCFRPCTNETSTCNTEVVRIAPPHLEPGQKKMLLASWQKLERDIAQVGVITFVGMFQTHPEVQGYFLPFTGMSLSDLRHLGTLRAHALRFMATVEKCMHRLDEPDRMSDVLEGLGVRHAGYNAKVDYVDMLGLQFVKAVKDHSDDWTPELEEAWHNLVRIITFYVKRGWVDKQEHGTKDLLHDKMTARILQNHGPAKTNSVDKS